MPIPVTLKSAGELAHVAFTVEHKHGYYVSLRFHFPPSDAVARERLSALVGGNWSDAGGKPLGPGANSLMHLTIRRTDAPDASVILDKDVLPHASGFGADWFERNLAGKQVLPPGRYDIVVKLLEPAPAFDAFPAEVMINSDRGRVNYAD